MFVLPVAKIRMESLSVMSESIVEFECGSGSWKILMQKNEEE